MPIFIKLTPKSNMYKTAFVNCNAIESVFDMDNGAHINLISPDSYLEVEESAETVINLARKAEPEDA